MGLSCTMALGSDAPGKVSPAHTRHGGVNPMSVTFVIGAVPRNVFTYAVNGFSAFEETAANDKIKTAATFLIRLIILLFNLLTHVTHLTYLTPPYFLVIDGGAASPALPQVRFGCGPISKTSFAPFAMSAWLNHGLFHGWPFKVADWI